MVGPQETGTQALSYKGNAALGFGADGIGLINDEQSLASATATLNNNLSQMSQQSQAWNMMKYGQAIQDRNDTEKLFSDTAIDQPVSDADRAVLMDKLDGIHNFILADPQKISSDITTNLQAKAKINEFKALQASAKTREVELSKLRTDIANEIDPAVRDNMQKHLAEQQKTDIHTPITPYFKDPDPSKFLFNYTPKDKSLPDTFDGKNIPLKNTQNDEKDFLDHYSISRAMADPLYAKQADWFLNQANQHPGMTDQANIAGTLLLTNKLNAEFGHTGPNDPYYIQPIAIKDADGNYKLTDDPYVYAKGIAAAKNLSGGVKRVYDEEYQKGLKTVAETAKDVADASLTKEQAKNQPGERALTKAKTANEIAEAGEHNAKTRYTNQQTIDLQNATPSVSYAVTATDNLLDDIDHQQNFVNIKNDADGSANMKVLNVFKDLGIGMTPTNAMGLFGRLGITNNGNYSIAPALNNSVLTKAMSVPGNIDPTTKKQTNPIEPAGVAIVSNNKNAEKKFVAFDKNGHIMKVVTADQLPHEVLNNEIGYSNDKESISFHNQMDKIIKGQVITPANSSPKKEKMPTIDQLEIHTIVGKSGTARVGVDPTTKKRYRILKNNTLQPVDDDK